MTDAEKAMAEVVKDAELMVSSVQARLSVSQPYPHSLDLLTGAVTCCLVIENILKKCPSSFVENKIRAVVIDYLKDVKAKETSDSTNTNT
jgi:hypothetical protein